MKEDQLYKANLNKRRRIELETLVRTTKIENIYYKYPGKEAHDKNVKIILSKLETVLSQCSHKDWEYIEKLIDPIFEKIRNDAKAEIEVLKKEFEEI